MGQVHLPFPPHPQAKLFPRSTSAKLFGGSVAPPWSCSDKVCERLGCWVIPLQIATSPHFYPFSAARALLRIRRARRGLLERAWRRAEARIEHERACLSPSRADTLESRAAPTGRDDEGDLARKRPRVNPRRDEERRQLIESLFKEALYKHTIELARYTNSRHGRFLAPSLDEMRQGERIRFEVGWECALGRRLKRGAGSSPPPNHLPLRFVSRTPLTANASPLRPASGHLRCYC